MLVALDRQLEAQQTPLKQALVEWVRIPSVCDEGAEGFPFGPAVDSALRWVLALAAGMGFRTHYGDGGYYGYAETGEGTELFGVLGNVDVVAAGNLEDWASNPFDPVERDGLLFGRGTQDDKGPLLAALFAVRALMDAGVRLNKRVRFIFGTDKESGWRGVKHYKQKEELPAMAFAPGARFPLVYAEKGVLRCMLRGKNDSDLRLSGGSSFDSVADSATYRGTPHDDLVEELGARGFLHASNENVVIVMGKTAAAAEPEKGTNAIVRLCLALDALGTESAAVRFVAREVGEDPHARRLFGPCTDKPSGRLTFNVAKIDIDDEEQIAIDCRIPVTIAKEIIEIKLSDAAARYGLVYQEHDWQAPIYLPMNHAMIRKLLYVYSRVSGDLISEPVAYGDATYARAIDHCVAFGALLPDEPLTARQPNERVVLKNLYKAMEIYAQAIYVLTR